MKFEHFALNVPDPVKMTQWYCEHCNMHVVRSFGAPGFCHFVADSSGRTIMELYCNKDAPMPDYNTRHHLEYHVAFSVDDAEFVKQKLIAAGARFVEEIRPDEKSHLVMLRDPFGIPLQLCQRSNPMNK